MPKDRKRERADITDRRAVPVCRLGFSCPNQKNGKSHSYYCEKCRAQVLLGSGSLSVTRRVRLPSEDASGLAIQDGFWSSGLT